MQPPAAHSAELDEIALGERSPESAWSTLRAWVDSSPPDLERRLYIVLKAVTLGQLKGRRRSELNDWVEVIRSASALLRARQREATAERLLALADLTADWGRKSQTIAPEALLKRPYVAKLLEALRGQSGPAAREDLRRALDVGTANLSRVLGMLEAAGLVRRTPDGRTTTIELTTEGREWANRRRIDVEPARSLVLPPPEKTPTVGEMITDVASRGRHRKAFHDLPLDKVMVATIFEGRVQIVGKVVLKTDVVKSQVEHSQGLVCLVDLDRDCIPLNSSWSNQAISDHFPGRVQKGARIRRPAETGSEKV